MADIGGFLGGKGKDAALSGFQSGFRPYPSQGFNVSPPGNYWEGGNLISPGAGGGPLMTSNLASNFPNLAQYLTKASPAQSGGGANIGARGGLGGKLGDIRGRLGGLFDAFLDKIPAGSRDQIDDFLNRLLPGS